MFLAFAYYPFCKKSDKTKPTWWDRLMMILVVVSTAYTIWNVTPLAMRGGIANTTDIVIGTSYLSSRHARFSPIGDDLVVEDLGSTNGTQVNGEMLSSPRALRSGDVISIGDVNIKAVCS